MWHAMRRRTYVRTSLWRKNLRKFYHLEDICIYRRIMLKRVLKKLVCRMWTTLIWINVGTNCGLLWTRRWTSRFQKCNEFFFFPQKNLLHGVIGNTAQWSNRISYEDQNWTCALETTEGGKSSVLCKIKSLCRFSIGELVREHCCPAGNKRQQLYGTIGLPQFYCEPQWAVACSSQKGNNNQMNYFM
jgi:hypothetical protein